MFRALCEVCGDGECEGGVKACIKSVLRRLLIRVASLHFFLGGGGKAQETHWNDRANL